MSANEENSLVTLIELVKEVSTREDVPEDLRARAREALRTSGRPGVDRLRDSGLME